jgi:hypothetical protein
VEAARAHFFSHGFRRRNHGRDDVYAAERFLFRFPRETMPWIFYAVGTILPTTYFISLMRAIILRGADFFEYWPHLVILIIMSVVLFALCALLFRKKIG